MTPPTIMEAVSQAAGRLDAAGIESATLDAGVLMRYVTGLDKVQYFLRRGQRLSDEQAARYNALIELRLARISVAYLVGEREFLGLPFMVGPGALVPRPETELLVEWAAHWLRGRSNCLALDVGTGSGAIAIGLTRLAPPGSLRGVIGIDPSLEALAWASRNRSAIAPVSPVGLVRGHLISAIGGPVDLVLANLPYLTPEQIDENPDLAAEPRSALVSGPDGLDLIRELLVDLPRVLARDGAAIIELDPSQAETVAALSRTAFPGAVVEIVDDLARWARFVTIVRTERKGEKPGSWE